MRWYILKALLVKEWQRHLANRGGIALALLLVVGAVLLSVFAPGGESSAAGTEAVGGVRHCFIEFDRPTKLIEHLQKNVPPELKEQIVFRELEKAPQIDGLIVYPTGTASIQIREPLAKAPGERVTVSVYVWHPDGDPTALAPYETWLWRESRRFYTQRARDKGVTPPDEPKFDAENQWLLDEAHKRFQDQIAAAPGNSGGAFLVPNLEVNRKGLGGKVLDIRSAVATALVIFSLYFTCVYLLPTLNCEERERGVLLAQALSPASPAEIVAAKFLFYPTAGIILAATITAVYKTAILSSLFFWLALFAVGGGFLGIGMTIATLARTQKAAFLGGMCYLMTVSMVLLICSMNGIPVLPYLAVEYHGPRILHAAITGEVYPHHWKQLLGALALAVAWLLAAGWLFRRRGWQ
jgi:hypothetical protein